MIDKKVLAVYTLDTRMFLIQYGLWLRPVQRFLETILPRRIIRTGGPRSVLESIVVGGKKHGWKVILNPPLGQEKFDFVLNLSRTDIIRDLSRMKASGSIKKLFIGPNIDLKSIVNIDLIHASDYDLVLVPSNWANRLFNEWPPSSVLRTGVWDAGVDVDYWKPSVRNLKSGFLIYTKGEIDEKFLNETISYLESRGQVRILKYGTHTQYQFRRLINAAEAVIWLGSTETQGLALCETWSMDVPTLVLKRPWRHILGKSWPSSSAPYLSESTGQFIQSVEDIETGIDYAKANYFRPRNWVLEHQSAEKSFERLINLVRD